MNKQSGQALVEFALLLPIFLVMLLGMAELTFAIHEYMILQNHSRELGRFAGKGIDFKRGELDENSYLLVNARAIGFTENSKALRIAYVTIGNKDGDAIVTKFTITNVGFVDSAGFDEILLDSMVASHQAMLLRDPNTNAITWAIVDTAVWHEPVTRFFGSKPLVLKSDATFRVATIRKLAE